MQSGTVTAIPSGSFIRPFRWSDLIYVAAVLAGAWYGMGEKVFMILACAGLWLLLYPLMGWMSGSFTRTMVMIFATLVLMFGLGKLLREGAVRYGKTIPAKAIPLIEKYRRDHGVPPKRMEDIPGMPWLPPLFEYKFEDEYRSFHIMSKLDYWDNWKYIEEKSRWDHFSM